MLSLPDVLKSSKRWDGGEAFFGQFKPAWEAVSQNVRKLETRQQYSEPSNPSLQLWLQGKQANSLAQLAVTRQADVPLYEQLNRRGVTFRRLRPVVFPLSTYLQWEVQVYRFNSQHGELIYFMDDAPKNSLAIASGAYDFVVFDETVAMVHDYDDNGLITGGWELRDPGAVHALCERYDEVWSLAEPYHLFLGSRGQ